MPVLERRGAGAAAGGVHHLDDGHMQGLFGGVVFVRGVVFQELHQLFRPRLAGPPGLALLESTGVFQHGGVADEGHQFILAGALLGLGQALVGIGHHAGDAGAGVPGMGEGGHLAGAGVEGVGALLRRLVVDAEFDLALRHRALLGLDGVEEGGAGLDAEAHDAPCKGAPHVGFQLAGGDDLVGQHAAGHLVVQRGDALVVVDAVVLMGRGLRCAGLQITHGALDGGGGGIHGETS